MNINLDECYQFGLGAFETIAIEHGHPVFLPRHLARLDRAADFLGLTSCAVRNINPDTITAYLNEQEKNGTSLSHCALKIMISNENTIYHIRSNPYAPVQYEKGFVMDFSSVMRNESSPLTYHKTMNYGDCILEKRLAARQGMNERIFQNSKGEICEGTVSNIFFVRDQKLFTPKISCGLLPGILREYLCESFPVEETVILPSDLDQYQECFVTNSLMGIMPVKKLAGHNFSKRDMSDQLLDAYKQLIV